MTDNINTLVSTVANTISRNTQILHIAQQCVWLPVRPKGLCVCNSKHYELDTLTDTPNLPFRIVDDGDIVVKFEDTQFTDNNILLRWLWLGSPKHVEASARLAKAWYTVDSNSVINKLNEIVVRGVPISAVDLNFAIDHLEKLNGAGYDRRRYLLGDLEAIIVNL